MYTVRTRTDIKVSTSITIGTSLFIKEFSNILISGFDVISSTEETADAVNISFGKV
jgi:hypothetical protein